MEIGAMLDELRERALKDSQIFQELIDTRKNEQPLAAQTVDKVAPGITSRCYFSAVI